MDQIQRAAKMAAEWWADRLQRGDRDLFIASLRYLVERDLREHRVCRIDCDYDPDAMLIEALADAGVECRGFMFSARGILPEKHLLQVFEGCLKPKEGYGNWTADIPVPARRGITHG